MLCRLVRLNFIALVGLGLLLSACAETTLLVHNVKKIKSVVAKPSPVIGHYKVGKAYKIKNVWYYPAEDDSYVETGIASWYGPQFHNKKTANGEIFNQFEVSAAHRTLPIPSVVQVTNLTNGRSLVVRVNDRGPFHDDRIIDLSYAAARRLGFLEQGTTPVRLEALTFPPPSPEAREPREEARAGTRLWLQAGAFQDRAAAAALAAELGPLLTLASSPAPLSIRQDPPPFYRVRIGPFEDVQGAERVQAFLMFSDVPATPLLIEE